MNDLLDRWTTPVSARAMLATINPSWGSQPTGTITDITRTVTDTATVTLSIRRTTTQELIGTGAAIGVDIDGVRTYANVELTSPSAGTYAFRIDAEHTDPVLVHLRDHAAAGDTLHIGIVSDTPLPSTATSTDTSAAAPPTASASAGNLVRFTNSNVIAAVDGGTSILDAAEAAELNPKFGCRRGNCRRCVVPLTEGTVTDLRTGTTTDAGTHIQICVNAATTDVAVEL